MLRLKTLATAALVLLVCSGARAKECGAPDLLTTFPPDGGAGVATNAALSARYAPSAEYLQEDVLFGPAGTGPDGGVDVSGLSPITPTWDAHESLLEIAPDVLAPGKEYAVRWPRLRGLDTASLGRGATITFRTGHAGDVRSPRFGGLDGVTWDVERRRDPCTNDMEDRFAFELSAAPPTDDGGPSGLALVVFQTRGPGIDPSAAPVPVLVTNAPAAGETARVSRSIGDARGEVCFAALARDLAGHASGGAEREVCAHTKPPPFFMGCAVGTGSRDADLLAPGALVLALLARRRRQGAR